MIWEVKVMYKKGVDDPEGLTALKGLRILGFRNVKNIRTAKVYRIEGEITREDVEEMCKKLLVNPISQDYEIRGLDEKTDMKVRKIKNGTVIDHIPAGKSLSVLKILNLDKYNDTVLLAMNVPSKKMGKKDILKIENKELKEEEVNKISLIAPEATINIIRDYNVVEKRKVEIPNIIEGIIKCNNYNCITNYEKVKTRFIVERKNPIRVRCYYCERVMYENEILNNLIY